jgi:hypothetical protein
MPRRARRAHKGVPTLIPAELLPVAQLGQEGPSEFERNTPLFPVFEPPPTDRGAAISAAVRFMRSWSRKSRGCLRSHTDRRCVGAHPVLTALVVGDAHESRPIVGWSILGTPCLASSFSLANHSVMIPQPSDFEMSSSITVVISCNPLIFRWAEFV